MKYIGITIDVDLLILQIIIWINFNSHNTRTSLKNDLPVIYRVK